jgi:hypothetical protein
MGLAAYCCGWFVALSLDPLENIVFMNLETARDVANQIADQKPVDFVAMVLRRIYNAGHFVFVIEEHGDQWSLDDGGLDVWHMGCLRLEGGR